MAISYERARQAVADALEPSWDIGTFCIDDRTIVENDDVWVFDVGAREYLVDGDERFAVVGSVPVVAKADGTLTWRPSVEVAYDQSIRSRPNPHPTLHP